MDRPKIDISVHYGRLHEQMTQYGVLGSLQAIWAYHQNITDDVPLPKASVFHDASGAQVPLKSHIFLWDLALLAREVVLTASSWGGESLESWNNLASVMNRVRGIENQISKLSSEAQGENYDVLWDLFPLIHSQFEWQRPATRHSLVRYHKIFAESEIGALIEGKTGLTMRQLYLMTFATAGHFLRTPCMLTSDSYEIVGISEKQRDAYFNLMAIDVASLREVIVKAQRYDASWPYTFNPLQNSPLVRIDHQNPERVVCPIPSYLMKRVSQGVFYDVAGAKGFNEIYGSAFEAYVGKVLLECFSGDRFQVTGETPYYVAKKQIKHGVDWMVQDDTATVFIECKVKRIRQEARSGESDEALHEALVVMAEYIVQHYKNIADALHGLTSWKPDGKPVYFLLLTLESWWIFNPRVRGVLDDHIKRRLVEAEIDEAILDDIPYTIASIDEAERAFFAIADVGIAGFFSAKVEKEHREWSLFPFFQKKFSDIALEKAYRLFDGDFAKLFPEIARESGEATPA